jgi:hypothetical protein
MQCVKSAKDERYGPVSATFRDRTIAEVPDAVITVTCALDYGWSYHPKHVEQFTEIQFNVYSRILWEH